MNFLVQLLPLLLSMAGPKALKSLVGTKTVQQFPKLAGTLSGGPANIGASLAGFAGGDYLISRLHPQEEELAIQSSNQGSQFTALMDNINRDNDLNLQGLLGSTM